MLPESDGIIGTSGAVTANGEVIISGGDAEGGLKISASTTFAFGLRGDIGSGIRTGVTFSGISPSMVSVVNNMECDDPEERRGGSCFGSL